MKKIVYLIITVLSFILFTLTMRGDMGVPSPQQIDLELHNSGQAFETSQERARFATILSLYYDHTTTIDPYASMATPDLGKLNNHYYSLFPPTVSAFALPFYALGLQIGSTQLMVFALPMLVSLLTMLLIVKFCQKLELHWSVALFSAVAFGFGTNAWGYSVTLYAHVFSAFVLLLGLYMTSFWTERMVLLRNLLVWFLYGISVYIDYPNIFIYFPIALLLTLQGFTFSNLEEKYKLAFNWKYFITPFLFVGMLGLYGYYNYANFGNPMQFSNALPRVQDLKDANKATPERQKNSGQVLKSRNMLEGLRTFSISHDRGILVYSPIVLLSVLGIGFLKGKRKIIEVGLISVPLTSLVLYSMFGDPYGGWAFGSRYLLAIFPPLCILAGIGLARFAHKAYVKLLYLGVFLYSCAVALLAPLTTNVIPPEIEATGLGLDSSYSINLDMLHKNQLNSFVYNHVLHQSITGEAYYLIVFVLIALVGTSSILLAKRSKNV